MVDSIVGILLLAIVALSVSSAYETLARIDKAQRDRIERLADESDAAPYAAWY